jgi:hypothetical protein
MNHLSPETIAALQHALDLSASVAATLITAIVSTAPVWAPAAWALGRPLLRAAALRVASAQTVAALETLEAVLKPALSVAMDEINQQLAKARAPNSPGGSTITQEEYQAGIAAGVHAMWSSMDKRGILRRVVEAYGGEDAVKASIRVMLQRGLSAKHGVDKPAGA